LDTLVCRDHGSVLSAETICLLFKEKMFLKLLSSSEVSDGILTMLTLLDME
jgi:hypothetical protein